jgi:hypothetical protein
MWGKEGRTARPYSEMVHKGKRGKERKRADRRGKREKRGGGRRRKK